MSKLKQAKVKLTYKVREDNNNYFVDITLRNTSGQIAFFNQLQFLEFKDESDNVRHSIQIILLPDAG